jgi:hypothetical protein
MTSDPAVDGRTPDSEPASDPAAEPLQDVWLMGYPLRLGVRASEHYESVFREFALLASSEPGPSVPGRMMALVEEMERRYARNNAHEQQRDAALARGEEVLDIRLQVPASAGQIGRRLERMLDETDDFCRDGLLLTLAPADDVVAFRRWYLDELVRQLDGVPPTPWPGEAT